MNNKEQVINQSVFYGNDIGIDILNDRDKVKQRVVYKLINPKNNEKLLEEVPHRLILDLAQIYQIYLDGSLLTGKVTIKYDNLEYFGLDESELAELAAINTPRLLKANIEYMGDMLLRMTGVDMLEEGSPNMVVVSNEKYLDGAAAMLYPDTVRGVFDLIGDFYVLPSSVHECICVPKGKDGDPQALRELVSFVNRTEVAENEVLSDNIYEFRDGKLIEYAV